MNVVSEKKKTITFGISLGSLLTKRVLNSSRLETAQQEQPLKMMIERVRSKSTEKSKYALKSGRLSRVASQSLRRLLEGRRRASTKVGSYHKVHSVKLLRDISNCSEAEPSIIDASELYYKTGNPNISLFSSVRPPNCPQHLTALCEQSFSYRTTAQSQLRFRLGCRSTRNNKPRKCLTIKAPNLNLNKTEVKFKGIFSSKKTEHSFVAGAPPSANQSSQNINQPRSGSLLKPKHPRFTFKKQNVSLLGLTKKRAQNNERKMIFLQKRNNMISHSQSSRSILVQDQSQFLGKSKRQNRKIRILMNEKESENILDNLKEELLEEESTASTLKQKARSLDEDECAIKIQRWYRKILSRKEKPQILNKSPAPKSSSRYSNANAEIEDFFEKSPNVPAAFTSKAIGGVRMLLGSEEILRESANKIAALHADTCDPNDSFASSSIFERNSFQDFTLKKFQDVLKEENVTQIIKAREEILRYREYTETKYLKKMFIVRFRGYLFLCE